MAPDTDPSALVADVLTGRDVDRRHIPQLLELLDVGDRQVQLGAATALCVIAEKHPGSVTSIVGRLDDRTDEAGLAAGLALEYLAARYPDVVADTLDSGARTDRDHAVEKANPTREGLGNRDVGRTSIAGGGSSPGPRRVYRDNARSELTGVDSGDRDTAGMGSNWLLKV